MPNDLQNIHRLIDVAERDDIEISRQTSPEKAIQTLLLDIQFEANRLCAEIVVIKSFLLASNGRTISAILQKVFDVAATNGKETT